MSGSLGLTLAVSNKSKPTQKQNQSNLTENKQPQMFWRHILKQQWHDDHDLLQVQACGRRERMGVRGIIPGSCAGTYQLST